MSTEENKALSQRFIYEVLNKKNLQAIDDLIAPDAIDHAAPPGVPPGSEGVKQFLAMVLTAFPDYKETIEDMIAEGDKVVTRSTWQGTHRGAFMGIPPTGKQVKVTSIDISRVANGKFVEHWGLQDVPRLMEQLGVMPTPPGG